jgi:dolichyl-phosphate-mannose--protein O-mannosyl transferase
MFDDGAVHMNRRLWLVFLTVIVLAAGIRFWQLGTIEKEVFDELHYVTPAEVLVGLKPHPGMGSWGPIELIGRSPAPNFEHPLLGKVLIGSGMRLFGMNAFGWRFIPFVFGVLSIVLFIWLSLKLLPAPYSALVAVLLLAFDPLHILHSRMAMLDIFLMFFTVALYLAGVYLIEGHHKWPMLLVTALIVAAGMSCKHNFLFSILGFGVSYLILAPVSLRQRVKVLTMVALAAALFFHVWFIVFYNHGFSYIEWIKFQYRAATIPMGGLGTHPYASNAFLMLFNIKAVWYYYNDFKNGTISGIIGLLNPVTIYCLIPALMVVFYYYLRRRQKLDLLLLTWFACGYFPYILVLLKRLGFLYYMLHLLPILCLLVARALELISATWPRKVRLWFYGIFLAAVAALFVILLPLSTGYPIPSSWYLLVSRYTGV